MSIQAYTGPTASSHGAIVPVGAYDELSAEELERRQKEVCESGAFCSVPAAKSDAQSASSINESITSNCALENLLQGSWGMW